MPCPYQRSQDLPLVSISYVKFCPRCNTSTALETPVCVHCGHQFRSHLTAPVSEKTIAMTSLRPAADAGQTSYQAVQPRQAVRRRLPRPLLALVAGTLLVGVLMGQAIDHLRHPERAEREGGSASTAVGGPPYDIVFQSTPSQRMAPVATQTAADLGRWLELEGKSGAGSAGGSPDQGDYPETVRLYLSGRILLIAAGTHGRVLQETGDYRQVKITDGLHQGATGYAPTASLHRPGHAGTGSSPTVVAIP